MSVQFLQAFFIVWRESVEALLVVGILHAWLRSQPHAHGARVLWGGVLAGLVLAATLAALLLSANTVLPALGQEYLQLAMTGVAMMLIVQMVTWMRQHGRTLRHDIGRKLNAGNSWKVASLAALAVAREGSETVIFLYGVGAAQSGYSLSAFIIGATLGFAAAGLTYGTILLARRYLSARIFFGVTEILLLCLGAALALATLDGVTSLGLLPADWPGILYDPLWDSSALLADDALGGLLPAFTGYRSRPSLLEIGVFALYWLIVAALILRQPATQPVRA